MSDSNTPGMGVFPHAREPFIGHAVRRRPAGVEQFIGIVRAGPAPGAAGQDYADARYYIDRAIPDPGGDGARLLSARLDEFSGVKQTLTATNLAEIDSGTHLLAAGEQVQVFALYARGGKSPKVYAFNQPVAGAVVVQIIAVASGAGEYAGKILGGACKASNASALIMPMGLSLPGVNDALILNLEENALPGHRLKAGSYAVGAVRGTTAESPPRRIVIIRGGVGRTDSPATLGSTSPGSESADTAAWSRDGDGSPLDLYAVTRVVYNPAGDQVLYDFVRKLSFDARGLLIAVGAETRITVDTTETCP